MPIILARLGYKFAKWLYGDETPPSPPEPKPVNPVNPNTEVTTDELSQE